MPRSEKGPKLRTAIDVINRILWDAEIPQEHITIGYLDRFLGVLEKPFAMFSWEPLDSVDYHTFAIPKHRIQYFKYKDLIIWDKNKRIDLVFGSDSSNMNLYQVISNHDELVGLSIEHKPEDLVHDSEDDSDDGIELNVQELGNMAPPVEYDDPHWENTMRPNFFICQPVSSEFFIETASKVQNAICACEPLYTSCCTPVDLYHLTLQTLRLNGPCQVADCLRVLQEAEEELRTLLPKQPLKIRGVDNFHDRVIYAAVECTTELNALVEHLTLILRAEGFVIGDGRDFVPHISLVKLSRPIGRQLNDNRINPDLYAAYSEDSFGELKINEIYLCSMEKTRDTNGFYISPGHVTFKQTVLES